MPIEKDQVRQTIVYLLFLSLVVVHSAMAQPKVEIKPDADSLTPQIGASPANITVEIGARPASGSIQLFNLSPQPVAIHTTVANWDLDDQNNVRTIPPTASSMDQWTVVSPVDFTIPPGKTQTVRFSIRPRARPEEGESRVMIFFNQAPKELVKDLGVKVLYRLGVPIYGLAGKINRQGTLHEIALNQQDGMVNLTFDISSTGNAGVRMDGQFVIWRKEDLGGRENPPMYILSGKNMNIPQEAVAAGMTPNTPVLAGTRRVIHNKVQMPTEPGEYVIITHGSLGDVEFSKSFAITVAR